VSAGPAVAPVTEDRAARRPVAMVVHAYYDEDPRVRREAEALVGAGYEVDVFALRRDEDDATGQVDGVTVHRLDVQRHQGAGLGVYLREYLSFLVRSGWALTQAHRRRRFGLVQVHSLPDFLAFAALPLRLTGVPLLLDLHEAMPEFFRSRFPRARGPLVSRLVGLQERVSIALASRVITVNDALAARLVRLGVPDRKVGVVPNSPDLARFDPASHATRAFAADGVVRLVYAGALTPIYELDVALEGLARVVAERPELQIGFDVYGRGDSEPVLRERAERADLRGRVTFHGRIPIEAVPAAVATADIGLAPTRRDPFTDVSLSTKLFEYGAMGKPVVATGLPLVRETFPPGTVWTYEPGDAAGLAAAILAIVDDAAAREDAVARTHEIVTERSWAGHATGYVALVESLARGRRAPHEPAA
jgi:glycosyltransferase involved in cell wall biosynthesis